MQYQIPKGMRDVTPKESYKWQYIETLIRELCDVYGFSETRTPVLEHTELFLRSVGDTRRPLYFLMASGIVNVVLNLHKAVGNYCDIEEKIQLLKKKIKK